METTIVIIKCEFDIGQEDIAFSSVKAAGDWCRSNLVLKDYEEMTGHTVKDLVEDRLLGFKLIELRGEE